MEPKHEAVNQATDAQGHSSRVGVVERVRVVAKFSSIPEDGIRGGDQRVGRILTHSDGRGAAHDFPLLLATRQEPSLCPNGLFRID